MVPFSAWLKTSSKLKISLGELEVISQQGNIFALEWYSIICDWFWDIIYSDLFIYFTVQFRKCRGDNNFRCCLMLNRIQRFCFVLVGRDVFNEISNRSSSMLRLFTSWVTFGKTFYYKYISTYLYFVLLHL